MKTISKITLVVGIALVLFLLIINILFTEKSNFKLENDVLVYYQDIFWEGTLHVKIFNDGSIKILEYRTGNYKLIDTLSNDKLEQLKNAINSHGFTIKKTSLWTKYRIRYPGCFDCYMAKNIYINKNGETIKIGKSEIIWGIVLGIDL